MGQRAQELMEAGERQIRLRLHAHRLEDDHAATLRDGLRMVDQRRLADPRLAKEYECRPASGNRVDEVVENAELGFPTDQV
jgi:hypothetical protein